ncbi:MAG TPA: hypothetical protein DCY12_02435 [Candidatus Atribacteria bacterium]|nr:hypothetical protein [Candidatus Atribacteria bacterium]
MGIQIDATICTNCMACEMVCGYHRDDGFAFLSACIVAYRAREKTDYFGVMLKEEDNLVIARPEGVEINRIGEASDSDEEEGDASAKPMLLREGCDLCSDFDEGPLCVKICPVAAISYAE